MSTAITTNENKTQMIDNISILTNGELFDRLRTLSTVMANSGAFVPDHFRGNQMPAWLWSCRPHDGVWTPLP